MLHQYVEQFLEYCQIICFSERSLRTLTTRLNEFNVFIKSKRLKSPREIAWDLLYPKIGRTVPKWAMESNLRLAVPGVKR